VIDIYVCGLLHALRVLRVCATVQACAQLLRALIEAGMVLGAQVG
jgi:hypothetical protein